jgi:invasion protein IalB
MIRTMMTAVLFAVTVTMVAPVFVAASNEAQAQPAADRKVQPGSGQCRDSVGRKC